MTTTNTDAAPSQCDFVAVPRAAGEWLKQHYPALTEKAGTCERIGGRLYTKSTLAPTPSVQAVQAEAVRVSDAVAMIQTLMIDWINATPGDGAKAVWNRIEEKLVALAARSGDDAAQAIAVELSSVAETLENGDGFWRTCSGCHETEDGYPNGDYPYSKILKCDLGGGCSECGGIGAVWDNTDYEAMGRDFERSLAAPASSTGDQGVSE